jgi:hypothetical protein
MWSYYQTIFTDFGKVPQKVSVWKYLGESIKNILLSTFLSVTHAFDKFPKSQSTNTIIHYKKNCLVYGFGENLEGILKG